MIDWLIDLVATAATGNLARLAASAAVAATSFHGMLHFVVIVIIMYAKKKNLSKCIKHKCINDCP
jgi:hypothetical protein